MLFSGVHATLAGVILAMMIPINHASDSKHSLLHSMERALSPWVAFLVLPIFGFANAGVSINAAGQMSLLSPLGLGIVGGLFLGKQIGILSAVYLAKKARVATLPAGTGWRQIYGVAVLCGIGFTMSLFIGLLAFSDPGTEAVLKLSVLVGSLLSALAGALILLTVGSTKSTPAA
jgi:NhaA family Na+:H+ antiporter